MSKEDIRELIKRLKDIFCMGGWHEKGRRCRHCEIINQIAGEKLI